MLPAALLVVVACAAALAVALGGEDPAPRGGSGGARSAAEAALVRTGDGPAGSAIVTLGRWRYRSDPDNRGRDNGWARGDFGGRIVRVPYSP
ncbi:MAG TPA: hypothetical protein VG474_02250, partial [Solirubrobacteraceae bacterium]|nr:hypothetical protein [Solirubrobacteraceae bacterium]